MKIIHVSDTSIYNYDGISTYINELLECSEIKGDETLVLTTTPLYENVTRKIKYKGAVKIFRCLRFPGKPGFAIIITRGLKKVIRDFNPDIIWIHTVGMLGIHAAKISKGKYNIIYTKHCFEGDMWTTYLKIRPSFHWIFNFWAAILENNILRSTDIAVYHLKDITKIENRKFFLKFNFIAPPLSSRFFENRKNNKPVPGKKLTLGFCGRCDPDKSLLDTFEGLKIFREKHKDVELEFILIGDGPQAVVIKSKYNFLKIHVTGFVNDVIPYLDELDAFIISSKHETISISTLEAYARGLTIFSFPSGYLSESAHALNKFHLFETPEELADLLYKVLINRENVPGKNCMNILSSMVISYDELYSSALSKIPRKIPDYKSFQAKPLQNF